jgi:hypothetical protein
LALGNHALTRLSSLNPTVTTAISHRYPALNRLTDAAETTQLHAGGNDMAIERLFLEHPRSVGETYSEHLRAATTFGVAMIAAGFACILHALVPALPFAGCTSRWYRTDHA